MSLVVAHLTDEFGLAFVNVAHPSGEVHELEIGGMTHQELYDALAGAGYLHGPTKEGPSSIDENSAERNHMPIYTATEDGLFLTCPDGRVLRKF